MRKGRDYSSYQLSKFRNVKLYSKLEIQKSVLQAAETDRLSSMLEDYKAEMAIRPTNVHSMSTKLDDMLTSVEQLVKKRLSSQY